MANEIHRKLLVAAADLDFDTSFGVINSLPAADLCWSAPVTTLEDCDWMEVFARITAGTSPTGNVSFYVGRTDGTLQVGTDDVTLTDHGTEGTAADISRVLATLGPPRASVYMDNSASVYTVSFWVPNPGASINVFVYNNSGVALPASGHQVRARGWGPEVQ